MGMGEEGRQQDRPDQDCNGDLMVFVRMSFAMAKYHGQKQLGERVYFVVYCPERESLLVYLWLSEEEHRVWARRD